MGFDTQWLVSFSFELLANVHWMHALLAENALTLLMMPMEEETFKGSHETLAQALSCHLM